ncbi:MAG: MarR family transcriptional regulator [Alphaproteobacteria bacterium]
MKSAYLDSIKLIERMHRQFLEVIRLEVDRLGIRDINNVQALILYNIGDEELTVGELSHRGYYLGSNVSYNLRKMVENGYIVPERSTRDRRSIHIKLSPKGRVLWRHLDMMFDRQAASLQTGLISAADFSAISGTMNKLERFWVGALQGSPQVSGSAA